MKPKPSRRWPRCVVFGQVATGSRREASCFSRCLAEKHMFRLSPIILGSPTMRYPRANIGRWWLRCRQW
jgi:hypothetical protein